VREARSFELREGKAKLHAISYTLKAVKGKEEIFNMQCSMFKGVKVASCRKERQGAIIDDVLLIIVKNNRQQERKAEWCGALCRCLAPS
jgi:hypothetical protein